MSTYKRRDNEPWFDPELTPYENFERNLGLVPHVVRQHFYFDVHDDDVLQKGREALWYSVQHYDPTLGKIPFGQYASRQIERKIRTYITKVKMRHKMNSVPADFEEHPIIDDSQRVLIVDAEYLASIPPGPLRETAEDMLEKRSYPEVARFRGISIKAARIRRERFITYMKERYKDEFGSRQE